ncbi:hypothetical protein [Paenibacillus methanolicus]|uniref:Uncharacterized protein n=1 Tax=Paenibacillus methanolicus TaxID=582686 RepID=A0A5S5C6K5_9BACL|nr:hypothetical protein [Paenibacillus methanolicus]TYP73960.1 hypothetical protein BCM02_106239 [Paenibacillus methanolicus]
MSWSTVVRMSVGVLAVMVIGLVAFIGLIMTSLGGELPKLDGATALYPLYAAFAQAVYLTGRIRPTAATALSRAAAPHPPTKV